MFINFIESELQPFIEENYKTEPERTLIGQSLGGLLTTEILFKKPELMDHYIIVSPSLWWDNESLLEFNPKPYPDKKSVYIAVGKEGKVMERTTKELYSKLKRIGGQNTQLYFEFLKNKNHGDALHQAVYDAFERMFHDRGE